MQATRYTGGQKDLMLFMLCFSTVWTGEVTLSICLQSFFSGFFFLSFIFHFFFLNRKAGMFSGFYVVTQNCKFCIVNCVFITLCINVTEDSGEVFHTQGIR